MVISMEKQVKILAFAGSLRKGSFNKALVRAAVEVAPENVSMEVFDLKGFHPSTKTTKIICRLKLQSSKKKSGMPTLS